MRTRLTIASLSLCVLAACAEDDVSGPPPYRPGEYEGVEETSEALSDLSAQCSFDARTGLLELALHDGDVAILVRSSDGRPLINGYACGAATISALRRVAVTEGSVGDQTFIIDYSGGLLATGRSGAAGITVDLGGQSSEDALKILGAAGTDSIVFGAAGIAVNGDPYPDVTAVGAEQVVVSLGDGNDSFSGAGNTATGAPFPARVELYGGSGNDTLRGGDGDDLCVGGEGNDLFAAGPADDGGDVLRGGGGVDTADYSSRAGGIALSLDGMANDGADGGAEGDDLEGDIDILRGGPGDDVLAGGDGGQTIYGGAGKDILTGGGGVDTLHGEAGDDRFVEGSLSSGADTLNGGAGADTVDYSMRAAAVAVTLDARADDGQSGEGDRVSADIENATGGDGGDRLTGSASANLLIGGGGDDTLLGGDGVDLLRGGDGNDTLNGGNGDDVLDAEESALGNDTMIGGAGVDRADYSARSSSVVIVMDGASASGESGEADKVSTDVENLRAGAAADSVTGNGLDNILEGGDGDDTLDGGAGDDAIDGEAGSDAIDCGPGDADVLLDTSTSSVDGCEL